MSSGDDSIVQVKALLIDPDQKAPVVVLETAEGGTLVPIWIGLSEATSIAMVLEGRQSQRPLTHDLLASILKHSGYELESVRIHTLQDGVFFGSLELKLASSSQIIELDCRPSDAMALAVRTGSPILVSHGVLEQAGIPAMTEDEALQRVLDDLRPEDLGDYEM